MTTRTEPQPKGLYVLFLTEFWERYGFYTTVFLLVLFATEKLGMSDAEAGLLFGTYTAFIYATTVAGGFLADRLLGFRTAIFIGAATMAVGYGLLGFGGGAMVYAGLAVILVGNGFFKPNVSSLLGTLYRTEDERRDSGYTLFYMGINIGGGLAALASGYIARWAGFETAFLIAGIGKCLSFATFYFGQRFLDGKGLAPPGRPLFRSGFAHIPNFLWLALGMAGAVVLAYYLLKNGDAAGAVLAAICLVFVAIFLVEIFRLDPSSRRRPYAMLALFVFAGVFWAVWNQSGDSIILFVERLVDRDVFGRTVPPSSFAFLNPVFIIVGAPLFATLWVRLGARHLAPAETGKFVIGLILLGCAFLVLRLPETFTGLDTLIAPGWLIVFFCLYSFGELCVSPVGLAMVSRLAPQRLLGLSMGLWFLVMAVGNYASGLLSRLAAVPAGATGPDERSIYQAAFLDYGLLAIAAGIVLLALTPMIRRLIARPDRS